MKIKILLFIVISAFNVFSFTLKETVDFSLKNSPEFKKIELELSRSNNTFLKEKTKYVPGVSFNADDSDNRSVNISQHISDGSSLSFSINKDLSLDTTTKSLYISQKLWHWKDNRGKVSEINNRISKLNFEKNKKNFIFDVVNRYYAILKAQERLAIEENSYERWQKSVEYANARFNSGSANKFDVLNAKLNLMNSKNSILIQKNTLWEQKQSFKIYIGMDVKDKIDFKDDITYTKLKNKKEGYKEDVKIQQLYYDIQKINTEDYFKRSKPDIDYSARAFENNSGDVTWNKSMSYSFELGLSDDTLSYRNSYIDLKKSELDLDTYIKRADLQKESIWKELNIFEESIKIKMENLEIAEENLNFSQLSFKKGLISFIDLQDSQNKYTVAKQQYVNALIDNRILILNYIKTCGEDVYEYIVKK